MSVTTYSRNSGVLQVIIVLVAGITLAILAAKDPPLFLLGGTLSALLLILFLQRPDLALLIVLFARASSDALLLFISSTALGSLAGTLGSLRGLILNPNTALILILIVAGVLTILIRRLPILSLPGGTLLILLSLVGLFGIVRSDEVLYSFAEWLPMLAAPVTYGLAAGLFKDHSAIFRMVKVLAASFLLPALLGYDQLLAGVGVRDAAGFIRIHGTFVHPNPFGLYLVSIIAVFVPIAFFRSRMGVLSRLIALASAPLLLATYARFAWVGSLIVLFCIGVMRHRILLLIIPLIGLLALMPAVQMRIEDPLGGSFADRVSIWRGIYRGWIEEARRDGGVSILGGLGPGASALLTVQFRGALAAPHNDYLRVLVDHGVVGLLLYVFLMVTMVRVGYQAWKASRYHPSGAVALSFFALALVYPLMSLTSNIVAATHNQLYYWALAGLCVSLRENAQEHISP